MESVSGRGGKQQAEVFVEQQSGEGVSLGFWWRAGQYMAELADEKDVVGAARLEEAARWGRFTRSVVSGLVRIILGPMLSITKEAKKAEA